jgi:hypothetical protein
MFKISHKEKLFMIKLVKIYILWMLVITVELHLSRCRLFRLAWPFGETFSYCKCISYFHGLNPPPNHQIHMWNYVLIFICM